MSVVDTAKTIGELVKKGATIELQKKVMQLHEEALQLQEENLRLRKENRGLKERIELEEAVHFRRKVYWRDGDEIALCPYCYEASKLLVHLTEFAPQEKGMLHLCQKCGSKYLTEEDRDLTLYSGRSR
jgi:hypothetical protein